MGNAITKLTIKGYKSIRSLENFELRNINILIGPNGSGKSNFISFFEFVREIVLKGMQLFIGKNGGAYIFPFLGPKFTDKIFVDLNLEIIRINSFSFTLLAID